MPKVRNISISGNRITASGRLLRAGRFHDEFWTENKELSSSEVLANFEKNGSGLDLFSFIRPLPEICPLEEFHVEWENVAAARSDNFQEWWEALPQESRKNVRRSQRRGVEVRPVAFDDELVAGICTIYNESPVRQGRKFWHYGKPPTRVKEENSSYLDRSTFVGAYLGTELIGFVKFVQVGRVARVMQILSKDSHADKRPTNALLAKSVELCGTMGLSHFIYGQYIYGSKESSPMTEFKRRNGFERLDYPRHFLPLSAKGRMALKLGLHKELRSLIPESLVNLFLKTRARVLENRFSKQVPVPAVLAQD